MPGRPSQKPDIERQDLNTAVTRSPGPSRALQAPKRHHSDASPRWASFTEMARIDGVLAATPSPAAEPQLSTFDS
jgi:hypothetical protein